jgi:hypothetical protein
MSASPYWMQRAAMPIECVDVVQAVTSARFGPRIPKWIETCPAAALMMLPGMKNGEILRGDLRFEPFRRVLLDGAETTDARADRHADPG